MRYLTAGKLRKYDGAWALSAPLVLCIAGEEVWADGGHGRGDSDGAGRPG